MGKRAFTLIELLVVIAIIAILAAILFPVFAKIKEQGRKSACLHNLKQIGLALRQYADDSEGKLPFALCWWNGSGDTFVGKVIFPYTKSMEIWQCPSNFSTDPNWKYYYSMFAESLTDPRYFYCATLPMDGPYTFDIISWGTVTIHFASRAPTAMPLAWDRRLQGYDQTSDASLPHMGGWNCLYGDTHVKWWRQTNRQGAGFQSDY